MDSVHSDPTVNPRKLLLIGVLVVVVVGLAAVYLPEGIDWHYTFRPASLALLSGRSPYVLEGFFGAPWAVLPLLPFAILPENIGRAGLFVLGAVVFAFTAYRMGAKAPALIAFLLSPPVLHCLLNSNIDWLVILGFVLPPQAGLFFLAVKPQIGSVVALFWFVEAWRKGGLRDVFRTFWPISLALLISFVLFGLWPLRLGAALPNASSFNASLWPNSIPVGLALLVAAIRTRNIRFAIASSPCLSPYVLFHSWSGALVSIVSQSAETIAAVVGLWVLVIIRALQGGM